jgi:hypothetical protein
MGKAVMEQHEEHDYFYLLGGGLPSSIVLIGQIHPYLSYPERSSPKLRAIILPQKSKDLLWYMHFRSSDITY